MKIFLSIVISIFFVTGAAFAQGTAPTTIAVSDTKPAKSATFRPSKDQIKQGQTILKDQKLFTGEATGRYDDATRTSIKSYQKANGLDENGKFDRATLGKMNIALTASQGGTAVTLSGSAKTKTTSESSMTPTAKRPAPFRANQDQIKMAQKMMKDSKMYEGDQTGKLDDATREGLGKYQTANGMEATKTLNAATLEKMGIALTDAQKANVAAKAAYDAGKVKSN